MACQFDSRTTEIERNLLRLYQERTEADEALGIAWYPKAHKLVCEWSDVYGYSIATVACVIAAISPQCDWERNLIIADEVLAGYGVSTSGAIRSNVAKAERIRDDRSHDMRHYFSYGPKVYSFACNLAGDYSVVTVDTHALQAALANVQATYKLKWGPYAVFAECYANAAKVVGLEPATFQAILWHTWKRKYPPSAKRSKRKQWEVIGEY